MPLEEIFISVFAIKGMRVRKNVKNLSSVEKTDFVSAVLMLKERPSVLHPDNTTKNRYDDYVEIHLNAMMAMSMTDPSVDPDWYPGWAHNGPAFFPWHRQLLLQFENDLQSVNAVVTIPYWDWTDNASSPFTADFMGGDGEPAPPDDPVTPGKVVDGPFAFDGPNNWTLNVKDDNTVPNFLQRGLSRMPNARNLPTILDVQNALAPLHYDNPPWKLSSAGFRTQVEYRLHNLVHRWVNGTMMLAASPNDPVFWLHHANVDRLWGDWQRQHPEVCPYLPTFGAMIGHSLYDQMPFNSDPPSPWSALSSPASVLNHHELGYSYDSDPPPVTPQVPHPTHDTSTSRHTVPKFLLMREVNALTRKKRSSRR